MELQTLRLILRPFRADDLDTLAALMANPEFMRFSLNPYRREQTQVILQKFLSWDEAVYLRHSQLFFARIPAFLAIAVSSITVRRPKRSKLDTGSIPRIGTAV